MHPLTHFLLNNEKPTIAQLIAQAGDDVAPKEAANVIQFCFVNLMSDRKALKHEEVVNIFTKLFNLLLENKTAFTNSTYIATIFHVLGEITHDNKEALKLLQQHASLLNHLFVTFAQDENIRKEKAFATLLQGLGKLKDNKVLSTNLFWKSADFQSQLLDILERMSKSRPLSAEAIAIALFGLSRLEITFGAADYQQRFDKVLLELISVFLSFEIFGSSKSKEEQKDPRPNAQELSNLVYAIAKLAKHGALIPLKWQENDRQEKVLYKLITLIHKKKPEEVAISQIFYALGKLAEAKCLEKASVFWLVKPFILYLLPAKPDYRTIESIFVALGRLAEHGHILAKDFQGKDKNNFDNKELLNKLLNHVDFENPNDIANFFLSLGRLAEKEILTIATWQQYQEKFTALINKFNSSGRIDPVNKSAFFAGMQKLKQKGFLVPTDDNESKLYTRSPSVSPITHMKALYFADDNDDLDAGESSGVAIAFGDIKL